MILEKKGPAAMGVAARGGKLVTQESYHALSDLSTVALGSAETIRHIEARCLSALWHALPDGYDACIAEGLQDAAQFGVTDHRQLFRVLMVCALRGIAPNEDDTAAILGIAFPESSLMRPFDLTPVLWACASAAALSAWARLVVRAARRRQQVARLHRALADRVTDPLGDGLTRPELPRDKPGMRFSSRAIAQVLFGVNHG